MSKFLKYKTSNFHLGSLMRRYRIRNKMRGEEATIIIGFCSVNYLYRCETGTHTFPFNKIRRAMQVYKIPLDEVIEAATKDFKKSFREAMREPG